MITSTLITSTLVVMITLIAPLIDETSFIRKGVGVSRDSWSPINSPFRDYAFNGKNNIWLLRYKNRLLRSNDGGATWEAHGINSPYEFERISFIDAYRGWGITERGHLWQTKDSGNSWTLLTQFRMKSDVFLAKQLYFIDDRHGWFVGAWTVLRTVDGGISWEEGVPAKALPLGQWNPYRCHFINPNVGWLADSAGKIFRTRDGGKTWIKQLDMDNEPRFRIVFFMDEQTGWISGYPDAGLFRTDNGGKTWDLQLLQYTDVELAIVSLHFVDKYQGWAVGDGWLGREPEPGKSVGKAQGVVLRTADGGKRWSLAQVGKNEPKYRHVYFSDLRHGWILANENVYRTEDGGETWRIVLKIANNT